MPKLTFLLACVLLGFLASVSAEDFTKAPKASKRAPKTPRTTPTTLVTQPPWPEKSSEAVSKLTQPPYSKRATHAPTVSKATHAPYNPNKATHPPWPPAKKHSQSVHEGPKKKQIIKPIDADFVKIWLKEAIAYFASPLFMPSAMFQAIQTPPGLNPPTNNLIGKIAKSFRAAFLRRSSEDIPASNNQVKDGVSSLVEKMKERIKSLNWLNKIQSNSKKERLVAVQDNRIWRFLTAKAPKKATTKERR